MVSVRPGMFRDQIGIMTKLVTGAFDVVNDGRMEESIQKRRRGNGITKDLTPFCETAV